jgi:predicted transcriptional regulator YdeE
LLDGKHFCVEYYDERFNGEESGSIVEIWIPVGKG